MTIRKNFIRDYTNGIRAENEVISLFKKIYNVKDVQKHNKKFFDFKLIYEENGKDICVTYEVKYDRKAMFTGNVCFEISDHKGRKSGIAATKADYVIYNIPCIGIYQFDTKILRKWLQDNIKSFKVVKGGDNNAFKLILVPIDLLLNSKFCKVLRDG